MVAVVNSQQISMIGVGAVVISGYKSGLFCLGASQVRIQKDVFADMADDEVGVGAVVDSRLLVKLHKIAFFLQVARLANGIDKEFWGAIFFRVSLLKDNLYFV